MRLGRGGGRLLKLALDTFNSLCHNRDLIAILWAFTYAEQIVHGFKASTPTARGKSHLAGLVFPDGDASREGGG